MDGLALSDSVHSVLFNVACLYAFVLFIFGLLSLQTTNYQGRAASWQQYYGSPETAFQLNRQEQIKTQRAMAIKNGDPIPTASGSNRFLQSLDFLYYFFIRPSVLIAFLFAFFVLRHYQNTLISEVFAFGFSAAILAGWSAFPTKFIPGMVCAIGFGYGTLHLVLADQLPI